MHRFEMIDWGSAPTKKAVALATSGSVAEIDALARYYSWKTDPIPVMAAILKRKDCPLGTALAIFLRCAPGRRRDDGIAADLKLAEIIEKAVNAGRFTHDPAYDLDDHARLIIASYTGDPAPQTPRDWLLDAKVLAPLLEPSLNTLGPAPAPGAGLLSILAGLFRQPHRA